MSFGGTKTSRSLTTSRLVSKTMNGPKLQIYRIIHGRAGECLVTALPETEQRYVQVRQTQSNAAFCCCFAFSIKRHYACRHGRDLFRNPSQKEHTIKQVCKEDQCHLIVLCNFAIEELEVCKEDSLSLLSFASLLYNGYEASNIELDNKHNTRKNDSVSL